MDKSRNPTRVLQLGLHKSPSSNSNQSSNNYFYHKNKSSMSFESHPHDILPSSYFTNHFDHETNFSSNSDINNSNQFLIFQPAHYQEPQNHQRQQQRDRQQQRERQQQRDRQLPTSSAYKRRLARSQHQHDLDSPVKERTKSNLNEKGRSSSKFDDHHEQFLRGAKIVKSEALLQLRQHKKQNQTGQKGGISKSDTSRDKFSDVLDDLEALRIMKSSSTDSDLSRKKKMKSEVSMQKKNTDSPRGVNGIFQTESRKVYIEKNKYPEQKKNNMRVTFKSDSHPEQRSKLHKSTTQNKQRNRTDWDFSKNKVATIYPQSKNKPIVKSNLSFPTLLSAFPEPKIMNSESFQHAQRAGLLWQTIVGTFVRFPTEWFNGQRIPEMGIPTTKSQDQPKWKFVCLLRLQDKFLSSLIKSRRRNGKILLHIKIMDAQENEINDIAIGCFHSNAKNIFTNNPYAESMKEDILTDDSFRDVWMALRKNNCDENNKNNNRKNKGRENTNVSCLEKELTLMQSIRTVGWDSPISQNKRSVFNENVRVLFGNDPPKKTVFLTAEHLLHVLNQNETTNKTKMIPPTMFLLHKFCYNHYVQ